MATNASNGRGARNQTARSRSGRAKTRRRRARSHARRPTARTRQRGARREIEINVGQAGENVRRIGVNARQAAGNVGEAGAAAAALAREAAGQAVEAATDVAGQAVQAAGEAVERLPRQVGEQAESATGTLLSLPGLVRKGAQRGREAVEQAAAGAAVSILQTGTRVLGAAAEYLTEVSPRRRTDRKALEEVLREQLGWATTAIEAYDRCVADIDEDMLRTRLVRAKLEAVKEAERLTELLQRLGTHVPAAEQQAPPDATAAARGGGPAAARQGLAHALTVAVQRAEGWRALARIAPMMRAEDMADATMTLTEAVANRPDEEVELLRETLLERTVDYVLR
jgi:hypothetical protein